MNGPNLDKLRSVERIRRMCYGCKRRRMTVKLASSGIRLCSECLAIRDSMMEQ